LARYIRIPAVDSSSNPCCSPVKQGYTPSETESPLRIVARVVVVIGEGVVGMVFFVVLFSANFWDLQKM